MIKSDFNRCFIFGPKMRIFGRFGPLWPFWPIYWPEIQKNMFHTFHICPGKPPQGGIQNLRFLGGRIIFTIENTSVNGFFIEYGIFDCESNSNTFLFEQDLEWTGILIDANPVNLMSCM